jgi:hypothetical protein
MSHYGEMIKRPFPHNAKQMDFINVKRVFTQVGLGTKIHPQLG